MSSFMQSSIHALTMALFMTPLSFFLLSLFCCLPLHASSLHRSGYAINCGAQKAQTVGGVEWLPDDGFIGAGNVSAVNIADIMPTLSTLRYFPDASARKYCYTIPVVKGTKYLVRTTYYYGAFDGGSSPPVFDQIVDGMKWSTVDTSASYANGLASYYEISMLAKGKTLSMCLARNSNTTSSPFISALEVHYLGDSIYNSTDFRKYALSTVARHRFGYDGEITSYPDDPFNRFWEPFMDTYNPVVESNSNVSASEFWNLPPGTVFRRALTTSRGKNLIVGWPPLEIPDASYYMALYFQDNRSPSPFSWRVFDVMVNGATFASGLNVSTAGVMVCAMNWPLSGPTKITLTPAEGSPVGPVINAGELLLMVPLARRTRTRDMMAMESLARSFGNPPADWSGDPCLPRGNSWTGVTCSEGKLVRVVSLNLTNFGLSGTLAGSIGNLTAITSIWLSGNKLSGSIPDMSSLKELVSLHLENNQFSGPVPPSLGHLPKLQELFLQNNSLQGQLSDNLKSRSGITIQF